MKVDFRVHAVNNVPISSVVELDGEQMTAHVQGVEIELAGMHPWDGSMKLRFAGAEADNARKVFIVDQTVSWNVEPSTPPLVPIPAVVPVPPDAKAA
jgi:hypothetical protein